MVNFCFFLEIMKGCHKPGAFSPQWVFINKSPKAGLSSRDSRQ
jgi:hypothetical protein